MWYLITFEEHNFIRVTSNEGEVVKDFTGLDCGRRSYNVSQETSKYELEVLDYYPCGDTLISLNELNPSGFILLNHAAVFLRWDDGLETLIDRLKSVFYSGDKYLVVPVSEISASNFLPVKELNSFFESTPKRD